MSTKNDREPFTASGGSGVFGMMLVMSDAEEQWVRCGVCPKCVPHEGQPPQMRLLGDFGPLRGYQCPRCKAVWCIVPPNVEVSEPARKPES